MTDDELLIRRRTVLKTAGAIGGYSAVSGQAAASDPGTTASTSGETCGGHERTTLLVNGEPMSPPENKDSPFATTYDDPIGQLVIYDEQAGLYKMWTAWYYRERIPELGGYVSGSDVFYYESSDGVNWSSPSQTNLGVDGDGLRVTSIRKENGTYKLWFDRNAETNYATSTDGVNWTVHGQVFHNYVRASVAKPAEDRYYLYAFELSSDYQWWRFVSSDGKNWSHEQGLSLDGVPIQYGDGYPFVWIKTAGLSPDGNRIVAYGVKDQSLVKIESPVDDGFTFTTAETIVEDITAAGCGPRDHQDVEGSFWRPDGSACTLFFEDFEDRVYRICHDAEPASFDVEITETNSPVVEGDPLEVSATVENTGGEAGTQTVSLSVDGTKEDSVEITDLGAGETATTTLSWDTEWGDGGEYTVQVESENDSSSADVTVLDRAWFDVEITDTNSPVVEGDSLAVTARIENTGDVAGTHTVDLYVDGTLEDSQENLNLDGGESTSTTLTWETTDGTAGDHDVRVESPDDWSSATATVLEPAYFAVEIAETNAPVVEGESLSVTTKVENTGDVEGTQTLALSVDGTREDTVEVADLGAGETTTTTLSWTTEAGDAGDHTLRVDSEDDSAGAQATVLEPAFFEVEVDGTNGPVVAGNPLEVTATIQNTGDVEGTKSVELLVDGTVTDAIEVADLGGGETVTRTLTWATQVGDDGDHTIRVRSEDGSATAQVTVIEQAFFEVEITDTNGPLIECERLEVTAKVENIGGVGDTQAISLVVDGAQRASTDLTLDGDTAETVSLSWDAVSGDADGETATVSSDDDADSVVLSVRTIVEAIEDLIEHVKSLGLHHGIEQALLATLEPAIDSVKRGDDDAAIGQLGAFVNKVEAQSGKKIPSDEAQALIEAAERIIAAIRNCSGN